MAGPLLLLLLSSTSLFLASGSPVQLSSAEATALNFMRRYGYLGGSPDGDAAQPLVSNFSVEAFSEAIKEVQRFGGLEQTGNLDEKTQLLMTAKRCGVADVVMDSVDFTPSEDDLSSSDSDDDASDSTSEDSEDPDHGHHHHFGHHHHHHHHHQHNRRKRYILASRGWDKRRLTYHLANWPSELGRDKVMEVLQTALGVWAKYGRLNFRPTSDPSTADIIFGFYSRHHGDPFPFDGEGNVLAHAFFPGSSSSSSLEGDIHYDADEKWKIEMKYGEDGVDFFTVTLHELGHSLGLSHSPAQDSVMNPYYTGHHQKDLGYDDILAMYNLYVKRQLADDGYDEEPVTPERASPPQRPRTTSTTTTTTPRYEQPTTRRKHGHGTSWHGTKQDGCIGGFDTVAYLRSELFIIKNKMLWRLREAGEVLPGYPVEFRRFFHKLPEKVTKIDAMYERETDSSIVIFSGHQFWVFDGNDFIEGSPRPITDYGLPWSTDRVDGVASRNGTVYIFRDKDYWMYDEKKKSLITTSPKKIIKDWGFPTSIDSIMTYKDGQIYIFKGDQYWIYTDRLTIPRTLPRSASDFWLGC